jgi:hypothetical protein
VAVFSEKVLSFRTALTQPSMKIAPPFSAEFPKNVLVMIVTLVALFTATAPPVPTVPAEVRTAHPSDGRGWPAGVFLTCIGPLTSLPARISTMAGALTCAAAGILLEDCAVDQQG